MSHQVDFPNGPNLHPNSSVRVVLASLGPQTSQAHLRVALPLRFTSVHTARPMSKPSRLPSPQPRICRTPSILNQHVARPSSRARARTSAALSLDLSRGSRRRLSLKVNEGPIPCRRRKTRVRELSTSRGMNSHIVSLNSYVSVIHQTARPRRGVGRTLSSSSTRELTQPTLSFI